jgi:hypothetical protein
MIIPFAARPSPNATFAGFWFGDPPPLDDRHPETIRQRMQQHSTAGMQRLRGGLPVPSRAWRQRIG